MAFVKFTETGKSYSPKVSISPRGLIGFSQGARKRFELEKYAACVLYFDADAKQVAFEFTSDLEVEGAIKLRFRPIGADISAKSFLTYFNILPKVTVMYSAQPTPEAQPNWMLVELDKGTERKSGTSEEDDA